mmetsp:Transcript_90642/g.143238  ORF Transcript_90642/g.143238 Transcript_90642/m.143238 type:complete len:117 (+) Transcript_90642:85-435(+)
MKKQGESKPSGSFRKAEKCFEVPESSSDDRSDKERVPLMKPMKYSQRTEKPRTCWLGTMCQILVLLLGLTVLAYFIFVKLSVASRLSPLYSEGSAATSFQSNDGEAIGSLRGSAGS